MDIRQLLLNCRGQDHVLAQQSTEMLEKAHEFNPGGFFQAIAQELARPENAEAIRQLAGLLMKQYLDAQDEDLKESRHSKWIAIPAELRTVIRGLVTNTLLCPVPVCRHTAAQVVAKIGGIEVPRKEFPELIPGLLRTAMNPSFGEDVKLNTLEALGFLCEELGEIDHDLDQGSTDQILTAIVHGMAPGRSPEVQLAATRALLNSLEMACHNMTEKPAERKAIMDAVQACTKNASIKVRVAAYECLVRIASLYYEILPDFMQGLFEKTLETIKEDEEKVALQAVEFWSTLAEEEMNIIAIEEDCLAVGETPERSCQHFVNGACQFLVPLLTSILTKQEEVIDDDSWTISMAGGICLGLVAQTVRSKVVPYAMAFIVPNIQNPDWKYREAAMMAFGSILDGPSTEELKKVLNESMAIILPKLKVETRDPSVAVRDTAVWTLGRMLDLHFSALDAQYLIPTIQVLQECLDDEARVASNACFAIHNLACVMGTYQDTRTNPLSQYFLVLAQKLLKCADRSDWDENDLRMTAFEAINMMIQNGAEDVKNWILVGGWLLYCIDLQQQLLPVVLKRLQELIQLPGGGDKDQQTLQGHLCGMIQEIVRYLESDIEPFGDQVFSTLRAVFMHKSATTHEEALMAMGVLANSLEDKFSKFLPVFYPTLLPALRQYEDYDVCAMAVGCLGDIARAVEGHIQPYCHEVMGVLLQNLENPALHRSVKPRVISCFSDIAMAIGGHFEDYHTHVLRMMGSAIGVEVDDEEDEDLIDWVNRIREALLDAYSGIIQGLSSANKGHLLLQYVGDVVQLLMKVADDENRDDDTTKSAAGVIGDFVHSLGADLKPHGFVMSTAWVNKIVSSCCLLEDPTHKKMGAWARDMVNSMK